MMVRWLNLVLGLALIQGYLAFSPIPEMLTLEEEWAQFNARLDNPDYRLPVTTRPRHYEVSLTPYFEEVPNANTEPFTFDGQVVIYLEATEANVNQIVMHCDVRIQTLSVSYEDDNGATIGVTAPNQEFICEDQTRFLRINTSENLVQGREYIVRSTFVGDLQTNMRGFYRSWYRDGTNTTRWMGTTQFQPGHARQAFPCYDEPGFKATFDITIVRLEDFSPTISNMPIKTTSSPVNGRISETFHTTPVTSTYLLAFIVSHYVEVAANNNITRPFSIYARNNAGSTGDWSLDVGERLLAAMEEYTQIPYYNMAENMNMKQAAIPDFSAGAMENWGLLTYREALILYDPLNSNNFYKQRVANIVAHEIAHMWFGNLVTCAWWDVLWLNEGFARFYQYFLTGSVEPELGYSTRFIVEQVHTALLSDSVATAHPMTDFSVSDPTSVSNHFSTITYAKGACILRMTQYLMGEDTYVKGLRSYLKDRSYDVSEPHHLFSALDNAALEDNALPASYDITIEEYFRTWSDQPGHPVLNVNVNHNTGAITLSQHRFELTAGVSTTNSIYQIPLTWTRQNDVDFSDLKPSLVMKGQSTTINRGSTGLEWVIFNKQQSGFYRVNYDGITWALITNALRSEERELIHEYNRAAIIDDVFNYARSTLMTYQEAFNILSFLEFEDAYAPWIAAVTGFNFARRRLAHNAESLAKLDDLINNQWSTAVVNKLGFAERESDSFMTNLLRMYVMTFLCNVGHEGCVSAAIQNFQAWKNGAFVPANMRPWVYCAGLRHGNADDFDYFWNRYLVEDLASEQIVMIQSAGCTSDTNSLQRFLDAMTDGQDTVRPQDFSTALSSAITSNEENTLKAFDWLTNNLERARNTTGVSSPLSSIIGRLLNEEQITQVSNWLEANQDLLQESEYNTGLNALNTARNNYDWYQRRVVEFESFFETGYQEIIISPEVSPSEPSTDPPEEPSPDPEPEPETEVDTDSANIVALSVITLIVTLGINLLA